jgi:hypothetical protein
MPSGQRAIFWVDRLGRPGPDNSKRPNSDTNCDEGQLSRMCAPKCPYCPSAPHYKFMKREIYILFCCCASLWPKKTSWGAGAVGAQGHQSNTTH